MYKCILYIFLLFHAIGCSEPGREVQDELTGALKLLRDGNAITVLNNTDTVLVYHVAVQMPPDTLPGYYRRSGFIHPIRTPSGKILTDDFPEGHSHQHGLFFALVNTSLYGRGVDFWNQQNEAGTVVHRRLADIRKSDEYIEFETWLTHVALLNGDTLPVIDDHWIVRVYKRRDVFQIDFTSVLHPRDSLHVNEYHYGGLGFRGSSEWNDLDFTQPGNVNYIGKKGKGGFITSSGKGRIDGNHSHERWVSFHGMIDGDSAGVVIISHPSNFRAPQAVRLHPEMPYFSFSPMVDGAFDLLPGDSLVSRYRILAHDGPPGIDKIENAWVEWAKL